MTSGSPVAYLLAVPTAPNSWGVPVPVGAGPRPLPWDEVVAWAKIRAHGDARPMLHAVTAGGAYNLVSGEHYCACRGVGRGVACSVARRVERLRALVPDARRPGASEGFRVASVAVPPRSDPGALVVPGIGLAVRLSRDGQALTVAVSGARGGVNRIFYRDHRGGVWRPARAGGAPLPLAIGDAARVALGAAALRAAHDALGESLVAAGVAPATRKG